MTNISSQTQNLSPDIVNYDVQRLGNIKSLKSQKSQLQKVSKEFEAIFVTKMLSTMDKTVNREGGIFSNDDKYMDKFKTFIYDEIGRDIARNPRTSVGFAKQIYSQMERYLPPEAESDGHAAGETPSVQESQNHALSQNSASAHLIQESGERQYSKTAGNKGINTVDKEI